MSCRPLPVGFGLIIVATLWTPSCAKKSGPLDPKLVVIPFEYVGSAPDVGWVGTALSGIVSSQTSTLLAPNVRDAHLTQAPQIMEGYVTGIAGDFRVTATLRNEPNQTTVRTFEARGANAIEAAAALSRQLTDQPKPYSTSNLEAVRLYFSGNVDAAIAADPGFGPAHVSRVELLLRTGKKDEIPAAVEAAKAARLSELDKARLETLTATTPKARTAAVMKWARITSYDIQVWRTASDSAQTSKDHPEAIEALKRAIAIDPRDASLWNTLAYVQTFSGDIEAGKQSIAEYRKLRPKDANALDSLAELHYYEGRFAEAEKHFLESFELNNTLIGGGSLYRAALSRYLAGDRAKADQHYKRYAEFRAQHKDALVPLRDAVWLYTTGRKEEARSKAGQIDSPQAKTQILLWDMAEGKGNPALLGARPELQGWRLLLERRYPEAINFWTAVYQNASMVTGNEARMVLAWALTAADRKSEAAPLMSKWPLPPPGPEPGLSSVAVAKFIELKAGGR